MVNQFIVAIQLWFCLVFSRPPQSTALLGKWGERKAEQFLKKSGAKILARNFSAPRGGEADLVVRDDQILVFVEVKTRRGQLFGRPASAVDGKKRALVARAARAWLAMLEDLEQEVAWRIDVVEVIVNEENRIEEIRWNKQF